MSNILEEMRKRNMKVREIRNQYKLGLHPLLRDPDGPIACPPKDARGDERFIIGAGDSKSLNTGSPSTSEGKSFSKLGEESKDEDSKTETSGKRTYFDDFEYHDVLEDCYCKPFLDDEDWISSDEETEEENKNDRSNNPAPKQKSFESEEAKGLEDILYDQPIGDESDEEQIKAVNPEKVNWLKYIFKTHIKEDDPFFETINSPGVISTVLGLLLSDSTDEIIQGDLLDNIGYDHFDMLQDLISKRQFIRDY